MHAIACGLLHNLQYMYSTVTTVVCKFRKEENSPYRTVPSSYIPGDELVRIYGIDAIVNN